MTGSRRRPNQQVVPRPRSSAGRAGRRVFRECGRAMASELPKAYRPADVEGPTYERWLAADVFAPDGAGSTADPSLPPFVIIQPPPNITGSLHLGHAQRSTVEDLLVRHARMLGRPTLWLPGLDHASIAAQFVLDRLLAKEGESRQTLGRERYLERMRAFVEETRPVMLGQQRRVGASLDWGRLRFTMDDGSARAVRRRVRPRSTGDGLAYRTEALVNWCPGCRTSVSRPRGHRDARRPAACGRPLPPRRRGDGTPTPSETITVATTRPETILGDTAVAVHPDDARYRGPGRADGPDPVRRARRPDHRRRGRRSIVRHRRPEDHAGPRPRRLRDRAAARPADDHGPRRDALPSPGTGTAYDGLDRYEARRRIVADLEAARRPRRDSTPRDGHRPLPAQRRRRRAAPQDPVVHPDRSRSPRPRSRRPGPVGRGSSRSASRRPGSTG